FLEDYNIRIARHLLQGVDVWLNTPRRPYEACGTSGEKAIINGLLNFSISDGWWAEGYDGQNGWTIGPAVHDVSEEKPNADEDDSQSLFSLLENTIIPMFYDRGTSGLPEKWIAMIKRSMQTLIPRFSSERMLLEYYHDMYTPTARREQLISKDNYQLARDIADWKSKIPMRFSSLRLLEFSVEGIHGDTATVDQPFVVNAFVDPGKVEESEILIEMVIGRIEASGHMVNPDCVPLKITNRAANGVLTFSTEYSVPRNGNYYYGLRVIPYNGSLTSKEDSGLIIWG
ncbi:MAG: alpha-glucan family phosphorylase, partial [Smithellaceae bacterium]|nr:alpha-glucan family phosphorylase [Smithellaceae bacterium]